MKITRIDTHLTELSHRSIPFVVVHTAEGIHGVGEPVLESRHVPVPLVACHERVQELFHRLRVLLCAFIEG